MGHWVLTFSCLDRPGIVHAISGAIINVDGNITESQQYSSPDTGMFFMRIQVDSPRDADDLRQAIAPVATRFAGTCQVDAVGRPLRTLILASTAPHCLSALLTQQRAGTLPIDVPLVLANHEDLAPIAAFFGIPFEHAAVLPETKPAFESRIRDIVEGQGIELVVLARYMQIFSPEMSAFLAGRAINIHHSFLPGFKGANPYAQAHARGVKLIGATAHFITAELDEGPIIDQSVTRVDHAKSIAQLREIGRDIESVTLTHAVKLFAEHRILLDGIRTVIFE